VEKEFLKWLTENIAADGAIPLGIGDDAAVLGEHNGWLLAAVDMLVEGVHFQLECDQTPGFATPYQVGRKALAVNLSDMAAMAATPVAALVAVAANPRKSTHDLPNVYQGILDLSREFATPIIGGDTNSTNGPLTISVTILGKTEKEWRRSGGRPGDELWVTGSLGGSLAGHHLEFQPRLAEAQWLAEHVAISAALDLSDGLSIDLRRLAEASDCGARLLREQIPISHAAIKMSALDGGSPLDRALHDGEDFELLLAVPKKEAVALSGWPFSTPIVKVGELQPQELGVELCDRAGIRHPLPAGGFLHS
jgi:thiamine-monophosphate kinase